jgi:hypothetical protein
VLRSKHVGFDLGGLSLLVCIENVGFRVGEQRKHFSKLAIFAPWRVSKDQHAGRVNILFSKQVVEQHSEQVHHAPKLKSRFRDLRTSDSGLRLAAIKRRSSSGCTAPKSRLQRLRFYGDTYFNSLLSVQEAFNSGTRIIRNWY